jgi:hypothetical protein
VKSHTKLAGLFVFSTLATSVNATHQYETALTASDTGDYIIKINMASDGAKALVQQISAGQVSTFSADAGSKMVVASLDFEQAQKLSTHAAVTSNQITINHFMVHQNWRMALIWMTMKNLPTSFMPPRNRFLKA